MKNKNKYKYFILLFSFASFTILILKYRKPEQVFELQIRQGVLASTSEWINSKAAIENLINKVNSNPADNRSAIALGMAYIQEARVSGKHSYYDAAALTLFEKVLNVDPENYEALVGKATVLLSQHHFSDAIPAAEKAEKINPYSASVYGLLTDAFVETGNYEKAIEMADKMAAVRPDIRSYSRISYLREIYGDYPGAIAAMKLAVEAGYPGMEQTEWCRYQLGNLYLNTGDLSKAENCFEQSIYFRPSFAWAYAGKGTVEKAFGNYVKAIHLNKQAFSILPDFSFQQNLTELYKIANQNKLAYLSAQETIKLLGGNAGEESQKNHGHYSDKELAYACLDAYQYMDAYKHALIEYNRRPENIEVNQTLAWVNYKLGRYEDANHYIDAALKTHSKNPVLNYQAGLIKDKAGEHSLARTLIDQSTALNPYTSPLLQWERKKLLTSK